MPTDALLLHHLTNELSQLINGKIERIFMPAYEDVIVIVKSNSAQKKLLISCSSTAPRCCLISKTRENPDTPFGFLMHLRKHLTGGIITEVKQIPYERVIVLSVLSKNNMFVEKKYNLAIELLGKFSNIILVNENGKISDSAKHLPFDITDRAILPGIEYKLPPVQANKTDIGSEEFFVNKVIGNHDNKTLKSFLQSSFIGYAPISLKEAICRAELSENQTQINEKEAKKLYKELKNLSDDYRPALLCDNEKYIGFYSSPYKCETGDYKFFDSISQALECYYEHLFDKQQISSRGKKLSQIIKRHMSRCEKNDCIFRQRLEECKNYEEEKILGDLILANIYKIRQGDAFVTADNYFTGKQTVIELDKTLSPSTNAKLHYKKYEKMKNSITAANKQIEENSETKDYLESLAVSLECATSSVDYDEIEREMIQQKLIHKQTNNSKNIKFGKPMEFHIDGYKVLIGKNNYQNDALVKKSQRDFLWLHTQKIHGSHAVIEGKNIPQDVINKVASYCAYYSKASDSANVPVDYTLIKHVKKPAGAPPGKVIYTHQQTVNVSPQKPL